MIVATSTLGTGVDFLGILFMLYVDVPYSIIDFAQESEQAEHAGEDVDSVILVEESKAEKPLANSRGVDESVIRKFITIGGCWRRVIGLYLDGKEIECGSDPSLTKCDRCSEGTTAIERYYL